MEAIQITTYLFIHSHGCVYDNYTYICISMYFAAYLKTYIINTNNCLILQMLLYSIEVMNV